MCWRWTVGITTLLGLVEISLGAGTAESWTYGTDQGMSWQYGFATCLPHGGSWQSPIGLLSETTVEDPALTRFRFSREWQTPVDDATLRNTNTTYLFTDGEGTRKVTGGGLVGTYTLLQFHFHFGTSASPAAAGSEHELDGRHFPAEVHLVMQNAHDFAPDEHGHLAVLGFFIDIGEEDRGFLGTVLDNLRFISRYNESAVMSLSGKVNLESLVNEDLSHFYRYQGSLTTPPCSPIVTWTVFQNPLYISQAQYEKLLASLDSGGNRMDATYRLLMPVNGRVISRSPGTFARRPFAETEGARGLLAVVVLAVTMAVLLVLYLGCKAIEMRDDRRKLLSEE